MQKFENNIPEPEYQGAGTVYLVGGAVRDDFLEREITEHDWVVTGATGADLGAARFHQVGQQFPVFIAPRSGEEYALARTETKSEPGHTGFTCYFGPEVTLEEDLERRDLTINAMARSLDGKLIDHHGGLEDLKLRKLRHVSLAFSEDPLRVLRVARFLAELSPWRFSLAAETDELLKAMVKSGELRDLTPERIWSEMVRSLVAPEPGLFFEALAGWGALHVIWPDLKIPWPDSIAAKVLAGGVLGGESVQSRYALVEVACLSDEIGIEEQLLQLKSQQRRLRIPNLCFRMAEKLARLHALNEEATAFELARVFQLINLYRQPQYLDELLKLTTVLADATGRGHWDQTKFKALAEAAIDVDVAPLIEAGLSEHELGRALESKRIKAIENMLLSGSADADTN